MGPSRVLIVGAGGLGCPAAEALARAGVGTLTLADPDRVELSNLHRQLLHREPDLGRLKVDSAAEKLRRDFPALQLHTLPQRVGADNAEALFSAHELVIDGTDGVGTKYLLSDAAVRTGVPLVFGGVLRMQGQAMVVARGGPCLRCLYEVAPDPGDTPSCAGAGVLGTVAGVIGALQAQLALACLAGQGEPGWLTVFDAANLRARRVRVPRVPGCPGCAPPALSRSSVEAEEARCAR
jgi:adenylyltransferase/sulfurtransferase